MTNHWHLRPETGLLLNPAPLQHLSDYTRTAPSETIEAIEKAASKLPEYLENKQADDWLQLLSPVNHAEILADHADGVIWERLFMLYGYFASAWVHGFGQTTIPACIAVALVAIAEQLDRPPMLSYAGQVLGNWRLIDPAGGFIPENIAILQSFSTLLDEAWFFRVHVAIEAQAGPMLHALYTIATPITEQDDMGVLECLRLLQDGLTRITKTFHQMPDLCDPDVYYQQVRTYLMSFDADVIFEDVSPNPAPLRGGSGAQSTVIPALLAGLGIAHESTALTSSLMDMRRYMPAEHRNLIQHMGQLTLRQYCAARPALSDAYNHVLRQLMTFRRAHLYYARAFIFAKSTNPVGTGGTEYMSFLSKLIDETANYML